MTLPGAEPHAADLETKLKKALAAKGKDYVPRTHHLVGNAPKYLNRLIMETSPYLLQHAHNPVNWFPWGPEAFALAKKLNRPVLLSVGYSTCHWCHVMEKESFEDEEIAAFINSHYVAIKVDREERPDVDSVYMTAVQMMTGRGGWPMTVVMTPDKEPFFGGTYFPARDGDRGARRGFLSILSQLAEVFLESPEQVMANAKKMTAQILTAAEPRPPSGMPGPGTLVESAALMNSRFDETWGGFGRAPKFPRPSVYENLLRYYRRTKDKKALLMVTRSLDKMSDGGIYDHVGGGFHRYSTDAKWLVPHFEKMLYDNAQLVLLLLETYQITHDEKYAVVAKETLDYVLEEMTAPSGGFYSATDADSEGHEGVFFVWTPDEIDAVLGKDQGRIIREYYGVTEAGNFEGKNILNRPQPLWRVAKNLGMKQRQVLESVAAAKPRLYAARERREHPILDDKIIVEWNGQMISAFARAAFVFDEPRYLSAASKAAEFILENMMKGGRLARTYRAGQAKHTAVLEDYAFFVAGLLDLFETSGDRGWLDRAVQLTKTLEDNFFDAKKGAYYGTAADAESLLMREKPTYDGAQPSGNSVAIMNLLRLEELTSDAHYRALAEQSVAALARTLERGAVAAPKLAAALDFMLDRPKEVVIINPPEGNPKPLIDVVRKTFLPNRVLIIAEEGAQVTSIQERVPLIEGKMALGGKPTAYVCTQGVCLQPTSSVATLAKQLAQVERLAKGIKRLR